MTQRNNESEEPASQSKVFACLPQGLLISPPPKENGAEPLFRVVYLIDVNGANPQDAAEFVHRIMSDPDSQAPVLQVMDHAGGVTEIDLSKEGGDHV